MFALLSLASCGSKRSIPQADAQSEANPKLIFLNYTISKSDDGFKQVQFINKTITDGKLKKASSNYLNSGKIGDLKCAQLDKQSNELQVVIIQNPLSKKVEFVNDSLIFEKKQIDLENGALSLRLQLNGKTKYIEISEIVDSLKQSKPLIKTKLN
ncbi:hypothetical protein WJN01_01230 [Flavobacteriaceae bacterium SZ-1-7]|uniref:hypothetical protein n=1 Tax=Tamlana sedimenti TaxID=3134126 RepID=UPI0031251BD6